MKPCLLSNLETKENCHMNNNKRSPESVGINMKIPKETHTRFKLEAVREGRSMQEIFLELINKHLAKKSQNEL